MLPKESEHLNNKGKGWKKLMILDLVEKLILIEKENHHKYKKIQKVYLLTPKIQTNSNSRILSNFLKVKVTK